MENPWSRPFIRLDTLGRGGTKSGTGPGLGSSSGRFCQELVDLHHTIGEHCGKPKLTTQRSDDFLEGADQHVPPVLQARDVRLSDRESASQFLLSQVKSSPQFSQIHNLKEERCLFGVSLRTQGGHPLESRF
jgi:hypothetical protein